MPNCRKRRRRNGGGAIGERAAKPFLPFLDFFFLFDRAIFALSLLFSLLLPNSRRNGLRDQVGMFILFLFLFLRMLLLLYVFYSQKNSDKPTRGTSFEQRTIIVMFRGCMYQNTPKIWSHWQWGLTSPRSLACIATAFQLSFQVSSLCRFFFPLLLSFFSRGKQKTLLPSPLPFPFCIVARFCACFPTVTKLSPSPIWPHATLELPVVSRE